jgi:phage-related tail fiber protein
MNSINFTLTLTADAPLLDVLRQIATAMSGGKAISAAPAPSNGQAPAGMKAVSNESAAQVGTTASVTLEQVRALVTAKSQAGKMPEVKALLTTFGVSKVTELPAEKYDAFYAEINKIKVA